MSGTLAGWGLLACAWYCSRELVPHPCCSTRAGAFPHQGKECPAGLLRARLVRLAAGLALLGEDATNRLLPPPSRHENSSIHRFPGSRFRDDLTPSGQSRSLARGRDTAPDHLAAIRPWVSKRLTAPAQLQPPRLTVFRACLEARRPGAAYCSTPSPRRCRPRAKLAIELLAPSVTPRAHRP
jgi:hypothetical protein